MADGTLNIPLTNSDLYQTTNTTPNIVLQDLPAGCVRGHDQAHAACRPRLPAGWPDRLRRRQQLPEARLLGSIHGRRGQQGSQRHPVRQGGQRARRRSPTPPTSARPSPTPCGCGCRAPTATSSLPPTAPTGPRGSRSRRRTARPHPRDLTSITAPKVGLLALGSTAAGAADNITAKFDYFTITPDDTAVQCSPPCVVEQFDGNALGSDWTTVRPSGNLTVSGGSLKIPMEATDLYQTTNTARDLVLTDLPEGPFVATTKVTRADQPGLPVGRPADLRGRRQLPEARLPGTQLRPQRRVQHHPDGTETTGTAVETNTSGLGATFPSTVWLRLTSEDGKQVLGSYSTDGDDVDATWRRATASPASPTRASACSPPPTRRVEPASPPASTSSPWVRTRRASRAAGAGRHHGTDDDASPSRCHRPGRLVHHAAVVHPGCHRRDGRVGRRLDRVPHRRRCLDALHRGRSTVTGEGIVRLVEYRSTDAAGNVEDRSSRRPDGERIDTVAPTATTHRPGSRRATDGVAHHAAVVHPGRHRRRGRVGHRLDRVPHRRRRLDALHHRGPRDR